MRFSTARAMQLLQLSARPFEFLDHLSNAVEHLLSSQPTISPESLAASLSNLVPHNPNLPSQILDIINLFWTDRSGDEAGRLKALLQALIQENVLTIDVAVELLDKSILQDADIISNSQVLATRSARINTGLLYKQQKFNLLREENEGYAKLSHEFNLALSELPKGGLVDGFEIAAKSGELLTVVNALIGYFELDPNRVFDNILDVCSQNLLSHVRFVLHFLHHSPWAPSTLASSAPFSSLSVGERRQRLELIRRDFVGYYKAEEYKNGGSKLAARLLGFKFRYCAAASEDDVKSQPSPEPLIFMTALLIKTGFVKLSDIYLYVHSQSRVMLIAKLDPADDATVEEYRKWKEEMDEKAFLAKSNPLALAGALGDGENAEGQTSQAMEVSDLGNVQPSECTFLTDLDNYALKNHGTEPKGFSPTCFVSCWLHSLRTSVTITPSSNLSSISIYIRRYSPTFAHLHSVHLFSVLAFSTISNSRRGTSRTTKEAGCPWTFNCWDC